MIGGKGRLGACGLACAAMVTLVATMGCEQSGEANAPDSTAVVGRPLAAPAVNAEQTRQRAEAAPAAVPPTVSAPTTRPAPAATSSVQVEFDPPMLDMGLVMPNESATGTVQIRNVGDKPVRILTVKPSCKCTTINDLTGKIIAPGESVPLDAELEPQGVTGIRAATVGVLFEGDTQARKVSLRAEVSMPVRVTPTILNLVSGETSGHLVVESIDGKPFTVLSSYRRAPVFVGFDPTFEEPRSSYVLRWDLTEETASNTLDHWWVIETDRPDEPLTDSWIRHRSTIDFSTRNRAWLVPSKRSNVGYIDKDGSKDFEIHVEKMGTDSIYAVRSLTSDFNAELIKFDRKGVDAVCTVRVTPKQGFTGLLYGRIEMLASGDAHEQDLIGKVR